MQLNEQQVWNRCRAKTYGLYLNRSDRRVFRIRTKDMVWEVWFETGVRNNIFELVYNGSADTSIKEAMKRYNYNGHK